MRMRHLRNLNIGPADRPEGSCELVKWCQLSAMVKVIRFSLRIINHGVVRQDCQSWYTRHVLSLCTFMCLRVLCYCDACLKSSALRVGVKTLHNTQCQLVA